MRQMEQLEEGEGKSGGRNDRKRKKIFEQSSTARSCQLEKGMHQQ
jgi:hypothetical protein